MLPFEKIYQGLEADTDEKLYELYHENSKLTPYQKQRSLSEVQEKMKELIISFDYRHYPTQTLTAPLPGFTATLAEALQARHTNLTPVPVELSFTQLSTLLHYAYGISRSNEGTAFPHPFRFVPSAGALYPLEIYFHHNYVKGLESGLYHFNPMHNTVSCLQRGDYSSRIKQLLIQPDVAVNSSLVIFITAVFERSFFKYGERAYRFSLLEAGHVAQNIALTAAGMQLGCTTLGGFIDKLADEFLSVDGVNQSTLYAVSVSGLQ